MTEANLTIAGLAWARSDIQGSTGASPGEQLPFTQWYALTIL